MVFLLNDSKKQIRDARLRMQNEGCGRYMYDVQCRKQDGIRD